MNTATNKTGERILDFLRGRSLPQTKREIENHITTGSATSVRDALKRLRKLGRISSETVDGVVFFRTLDIKESEMTNETGLPVQSAPSETAACTDENIESRLELAIAELRAAILEELEGATAALVVANKTQTLGALETAVRLIDVFDPAAANCLLRLIGMVEQMDEEPA